MFPSGTESEARVIDLVSSSSESGVPATLVLIYQNLTQHSVELQFFPCCACSVSI